MLVCPLGGAMTSLKNFPPTIFIIWEFQITMMHPDDSPPSPPRSALHPNPCYLSRSKKKKERMKTIKETSSTCIAHKLTGAGQGPAP